MKVAFLKKENIIRIFTEPFLNPLTAFWLGKRLKEWELESGLVFYLVEGPPPEGEMGFFGTKIVEQESKNERELVDSIFNWIKEVVPYYDAKRSKKED